MTLAWRRMAAPPPRICDKGFLLFFVAARERSVEKNLLFLKKKKQKDFCD